MAQRDVDRVQEFRKCIECFLCQDVRHVLREHHKFDEFIGPRFFVYAAQLEMNPIDTAGPDPDIKEKAGIGYCNITKCCTKVCPEHIHITDNAIIPLKERVVSRHLRSGDAALTDASVRCDGESCDGAAVRPNVRCARVRELSHRRTLNHLRSTHT